MIRNICAVIKNEQKFECEKSIRNIRSIIPGVPFIVRFSGSEHRSRMFEKQLSGKQI